MTNDETNPWNGLDASTAPDDAPRVDSSEESHEATPVCPQCGSTRIYREGDMIYREVPARAEFEPDGSITVTERESSTEMGYRPGTVGWTCTDCNGEFDAPVPGDTESSTET